MLGTALVYSSHNRCQFLHEEFIVRRALGGRENRRVLYLPMSETVQNGSELDRQEFSWGSFRWFFDAYARHGLESFPFFWTSGLKKGDVDQLWHHLWNAEVVILGGGSPSNGMARYKRLGEEFDGEWGKFGRLLHERQRRGLLTVGFSAGADQLCERHFKAAWDAPFSDGFGLVKNAMVTLHHEPSRNGDLWYAAQRFPHFMVFGLPNDSGLYVDQGVLPSGNWWQVIDFVIDGSWDLPSDQHHVKTRFGALIDHFGPDGRHWAFHGGDRLVRVQSPDHRFHEAWFTVRGRLHHYWTREPSSYQHTEEILASH